MQKREEQTKLGVLKWEFEGERLALGAGLQWPFEELQFVAYCLSDYS